MLDNLDAADHSLIITTVLLLLAMAASIVFLALTVTSKTWRRSRTRAVARSVGLALPEDSAPIERRVARAVAGSSIGAIIGSVMVLALLWAAAASGPSLDSVAPIIGVGGLLVGASLGASVVAATTRPEPVEGVRVARTRAVSLPDFSAGIERIGARAAVAIAVAAAVVMTVIAPSLGLAEPRIVVWVSAALSVLSLVLYEVQSRRIIARPQPAGSPEQLAWDDAVRALHVRGLVSAPITIGAYTPLLAAVLLTSEPYAELVPGLVQSVILGAIAAIILAYLVAAVASLALGPQRHYLRRLWPEIARASR